MVIYWHGYLKHLEAEDQQVLLVADFPPAHAITTLPRLPLTKSLTNRIDAGTVGSSMGVPVEQAGGGQQGQT